MERIDASEPDASERLRELLRDKMGDRSIKALAREIGISEGTIRNLLADRWPAGVDTLALLVAWDDDFNEVALAALRARGRRMREPPGG